MYQKPFRLQFIRTQRMPLARLRAEPARSKAAGRFTSPQQVPRPSTGSSFPRGSSTECLGKDDDAEGDCCAQEKYHVILAISASRSSRN